MRAILLLSLSLCHRIASVPLGSVAFRFPGGTMHTTVGDAIHRPKPIPAECVESSAIAPSSMHVRLGPSQCQRELSTQTVGILELSLHLQRIVCVF